MTEKPTPEIIIAEIDKSAREMIRIALSVYCPNSGVLNALVALTEVIR